MFRTNNRGSNLHFVKIENFSSDPHKNKILIAFATSIIFFIFYFIFWVETTTLNLYPMVGTYDHHQGLEI